MMKRAIRWLADLWHGPDYELADIHRSTGGDCIMTVRRKHRGRTEEFQVIGSCTVWHYYPDFQRCNSFFQGEVLYPMWAKAMHFHTRKSMPNPQ